MRNTIKKLSTVFFAMALILTSVPTSVAAETSDVPTSPQNGIPLLIIHIDEDAGGDYKTIEEMNTDPNHKTECTGQVEIQLPEGYSGEYGIFQTPTGPIQLDFIRGRGNTTWTDAAKKPYKLKLKNDYNFFGMGENKNWELIANAFDPTLMKNRITYYLGSRMGFAFTPQVVPVDVVMQGKNSSDYLGSYCLTEGVRVDKNRVDIDKPDEDDITDVTGGYLLSFYSETQNADEPESTVFTTKAGQTFINEDPKYKKEDKLTEVQKAQRAYIRDYIQQIEDLIMTDGEIDAETHNKIAELMDLESAADYWWICEFSQNNDAYGTDSTFLYKEKNGKLCWGPLWDFDNAWGEPIDREYTDSGNPSCFNETDCLWINALRDKDPEFRKLLQKRWEVLDKALDDLLKDGGKIDSYRDELRLSQKADYEKWHDVNPMIFSNYDLLIEYFKGTIKSRYEFCKEHIDTVPMHTVTITYEDEKGNLFYSEKQINWSYMSPLEQKPKKKGYEFKQWLEKATKCPLDFYYLTSDTTFVPEFVKVNTLAVKAKKVKVSGKKLSSKAKKIKMKNALTVTGAKGKLSFTLVSVDPKKATKKITVDKKSGGITLAKKLKKGMYKVKIKVKAAGNKAYAAGRKTVTVTINVK
ncbi:MAG: CotH kinase family protein [Eubacterium sp.]|nr:CotH kinase family protein [Eubacterium sp.]